MNGGLQYSTLARLLTLNNQVHDLENQVLGGVVPYSTSDVTQFDRTEPTSLIAEIQEEIDQATRASLAMCWLGNAEDEDEYEL